MRSIEFFENSYYLLSGSGTGGMDIFRDQADYTRFIFLLLYFQSPTPIQNVSYYTSAYLRKGRFPLGEAKLYKILKTRQLAPLAFVVMPGHYHLLVKNIEHHSISAYMQRILMAYGKYFNAKYDRAGHVFDGPYKCLHLKNNKELLEASRHIHRDPIQTGTGAIDYETYPFSTCRDYLENNRWGELLKTENLLSHFKEKSSYAELLQAPQTEESLMLDF